MICMFEDVPPDIVTQGTDTLDHEMRCLCIAVEQNVSRAMWLATP